MANAFDAQTAWQTRNGIAGAFNLQITGPDNSSNTSGSGTTGRAGYQSPTPKNNSSNASNSDLPSNHGTQTLPHNFAALGTETGAIAISTGVYYKLKPIISKASPHPKIINPIWFPVTGDNHVDLSFNHQWDQADNVAKKIANAVTGGLLGNEWADLAYKQAQHTFGAGPYVSGCSVYNSSSPPTISIATKLFSADGSGKIVKIVEDLRFESHPRLSGGRSASLGVKGGYIEHPGWWDIEVISYADTGNATTIASMKDMICVGLKVTMYSPWVGKDPSFLELRVDFQHAYPGLAESMKFGGTA